jgi:hypothetical protein
MRKLLSFFLVLSVMVSTIGFTPAKKDRTPVMASKIMLPVGANGEKISLLELSTIKKTNLEKITGRKMNKAQSLAFKLTQKKLQNGINEQGEVTNKKLKKVFAPDGETGFHLGGFALGFLLGVIGVLIAYLIKDEKKPNRVKWAWIGLAIWVGIVIITVLL